MALGDEFLADPDAFMAAHPGVSVYDLDSCSGLIIYGANSEGIIRHESHTFTVVPEPASLAILFAGAMTMLRRRKK